MTNSYRVIFDHHPHPMWVSEPDTGRFLAVNDAAVDLYGYTRDEFLRISVAMLRPGHVARAVTDHDACTEQHTTSTGTVIEVEITRREIPWDGQDACLVLALDVTERQRAGRALRESEERFRNLFEDSPIGIYRRLPDGQLTMANSTMAGMLGFLSFEEARHAAPEERARFRELMERDGEVTGFQTAWRRSDGQLIHVRENVRQVRDAGGRVLYEEGTVEDITDRVQAQQELETYARELERSNQALEEFASVASHDLQEPLRKIQAFGERLAATQTERLDERGRDYLARMQDAASRMQILINDLLSYSRVATQALSTEPVDLNAIAAAVANDLETAIVESGGRVEVGSLPTIEADPLQMRRLLQNLVGNGLKYRHPDRPPVVAVSGRVHANGVELRVADNGIGFSMEYADRIFGLFQRLHGRSEYSGTGIGLSVCRKIVERHGGAIIAESTEGEGTAFVITIPASQHHRGELQHDAEQGQHGSDPDRG